MDFSIKKKINLYSNLPIQVKASVWFLICSILQKGIATISTPIFTRIMSVDEYGLFNVFLSWMSIITVIVSLQLFAGVYVQAIIKYKKEESVISSTFQGLTLSSIILWLIIYLIFHRFWNKIIGLNTFQILCMFCLIWGTSIFSFWAAEQRVKLKYKKLVLLSILVSFLTPLLGIIFVIKSSDKVSARIFALVIINIIFYPFLFYKQIKRGKKFFSFKYWKYALIFNLPLIPHYLSQTVLGSSDNILIKDICGEDQAGIFSLAYSISLLMTIFNSSLMQTISPWIYEKIRDKQITKVEPVSNLTLIFVAFVNIILIIFAPDIVYIFAPEDYSNAKWIIPPLAMAVYFTYAYDLFAKFEFYYEKTHFIMIASIIAAILNIGLNLLFLPRLGFYSAGYITLFCYILYSYGHYVFMKKICKKEFENIKVFNGQRIFFITFIFLITGLICMITYYSNILRYIFLLMICLFIYYKRNFFRNGIDMIIKVRNK